MKLKASKFDRSALCQILTALRAEGFKATVDFGKPEAVAKSLVEFGVAVRWDSRRNEFTVVGA